MKKKVLGIAFFTVILIVMLLFGISRVNNVSSNELNNETRKAMTYNEFTDEDAKIENCEYVEFTSFFTKDLDGDGYVEKYDGTCNHINKKGTLYFDINVLTDGTLKNGKVEINGKNFNLQTSLVKDEVLKNDYIGNNITTIELNDIDYGTQKLFSGLITSKVENNKNNYSIQDNSVTLTGTWVSIDGTKEIEINKVIYLQTDWYGVTRTVADTNVTKIHKIADTLKTDSIVFSFNVGYSETAYELLLEKQITEVTIPQFNGYNATKVSVSSQNCGFEYDEVNSLLTIVRKSSINSNGDVLQSVSRTNTYTVKVEYPIAAYEATEGDVITLTFPTKGYYYGFNNSSKEFDNPYVSVASMSYTHVWEINSSNDGIRNPDFSVFVGKRVYDSNTGIYKYVISQQWPLNIYNGIELEEAASDEYIVEWRAFSGNTIENQNGLYMQETESDKFLKSDGSYIDMSDYISTKGMYFNGLDAALGNEGWVKVYDKETGELLEKMG